MKDERGSVLAFVLVISMVVMIICAGLARMVLMRSQASQRLAASQTSRKQDDGAVALLMSAWSQSGTNQVCSTNQATTVGYTVCAGPGCSAIGGACNCQLTGAGLPGVRVDAACKICAGYDSSTGVGSVPASCP